MKLNRHRGFSLNILSIKEQAYILSSAFLSLWLDASSVLLYLFTDCWEGSSLLQPCSNTRWEQDCGGVSHYWNTIYNALSLRDTNFSFHHSIIRISFAGHLSCPLPLADF